MGHDNEHETNAAQGPLSRRNLLLGAGAGAVAASSVLMVDPLSAMASEREHSAPQHRGQDHHNGSFVGVKNGRFVLNGKEWRFGGTNCYYLHTSSHYMIDSMLDNAAQMKMQVVRCWAFNDDPSQPDTALQTAPGVYPEANYDSLDYTVYKAGQLGLKLVLPLVNNWPDYGGMPQYVSWVLGLPDDAYGAGVNHDKFYTDSKIRKLYLAYVDHVINRRNRYTGVKYKDDPTIMTWELANEPRNRSDTTGTAVRTWADEVSRHIKRQAPRHLVAIGDEGMGLDPTSSDYPYSTYEGDQWKALTALPAIDYGTVHLYPQSWGEVPSSGTDPVAWGKTWIASHASAGKALHKPVVLEEFGLKIDPTQGVADTAARDAAYDSWLDVAQSSGASGFQFWILTALTDAGILYEDYDGFRVVYPSSTATLMSQHAAAISAAS